MRSPTDNSPADILKSSPLVLAFSAVVLSKMSSLCICIFYPNETENFPLPLLSSSTCFGLNILSLLDRPKRGTVNSNLESSKFILLLLFSAWKMAKISASSECVRECTAECPITLFEIPKCAKIELNVSSEI